MRKTLFLLPLFFWACDFQPQPLLENFPPKKIFKEGFVNKYYHHYIPDDPNLEQRTRILYTGYQLLDNHVIKISNYDAAFDLKGWQYYHYQGTRLFVDSAWYMQRNDTVRVDIETGLVKYWEKNAGGFYRENYQYQEQEHQYISHQYEMLDTLVEGRPGNKFLYHRSYRNLEQDSTLQSWQAWEVYVKGLGLWSKWEQSEDGEFYSELIEQMPIAEFQKRANHGKKRVAWIDPQKSLGSQEGFKLCGSESEIVDYYNGDPDAHFAAGKPALTAHIEEQLDSSLLKNFEGMLTFRFVISCEGAAGSFIAEAYNFDYQKIEADPKLVQALFKILSGPGSWTPTLIREERRDAYAYLTLKISHGQIVDYLP